MSARGGTLVPFTGWSDGSAKYAILSGRIELVADSWKTIRLSAGKAPAPAPAVSTADLAATGITASIQFVYALNMDSGAWTQVATSAGPARAGKPQGTFGRWGYVPHNNVFALVTDIDDNAWIFRVAKP